MLTLVLAVMVGGAGYLTWTRVSGMATGGPVGAVLGLVRRLRGQ